MSSRAQMTKKFVGLLVFLVGMYIVFSPSSGDVRGQTNYAVMVDAGSSGSRIFVYQWQRDSDPDKPLIIHQHTDTAGNPVTRKDEPGLSSFADNPGGAFESLRPGLAYAAAHIPKDLQKYTPVYVFGTAGLRAIDQKARGSILFAVRQGIAREFAFHVEKANVDTISGEREAIYAWVTANYLLGTLGEGKTRGVVDLGGGSMQIAFEASRKGAWQDSVETVRLGSKIRYDVFRVSHLGYGVQSAHEKYVASLGEGSADPCLPKGPSKEIHFEVAAQGSGDFDQCVVKVRAVVEKAKECSGTNGPCTFNHLAHPPIEKDREFMGFSEYWYGTHDVLGLGGSFDTAELAAKSKQYCEQSMSDIIAHGKKHGYPGFSKEQTEDKDFWLRRQCFKSAYIPATLETAWGFPKSPKNFASHLKVHGEELQWTLGALLVLQTEALQNGGGWLWPLTGMLLVGIGASAVYFARQESQQLLTTRYNVNWRR